MTFTQLEESNFNHILNDYTAIYLKVESIILETTTLNKELVELQTKWEVTKDDLLLEEIIGIETKLNEYILSASEIERALIDLKGVENTMYKHLALKYNISAHEIKKEIVKHLNIQN
jgi:hypothetical protein